MFETIQVIIKSRLNCSFHIRAGLQALYKKTLMSVLNFLSYFDWILFYRHLADIGLRKTEQIIAKHFSNLNWLRKHRFCSAASVGVNSIVSLPNYELSDTGQFVFAYGLEFCFPPTKINQ